MIRSALVIALGFLLPFSLPAEDQIAFTENGERVILHEDGTWEYAPQAPQEQPQVQQNLGQRRFGAWTLEQTEDTMSGQVETLIWVESYQEVRNWAGRKVTPRLVLRCSGKKMDLFISWGETAEAASGEETQVHLDFGPDRKTGRIMRRSVDDQAVFFHKPVKDLPMFLENDLVSVRMDLFRQKGLAMTFPLDGLQAAIKASKMKCKS